MDFIFRSLVFLMNRKSSVFFLLCLVRVARLYVVFTLSLFSASVLNKKSNLLYSSKLLFAFFLFVTISFSQSGYAAIYFAQVPNEMYPEISFVPLFPTQHKKKGKISLPLRCCYSATMLIKRDVL